MEELQRMCNELKDENEVAIIKKYGGIAKFYTAALICERQHDAIFSKYLFVFEFTQLK